MNDTQQPTNEQKKENIINALTIAGFTENPEYPGMYARDRGNIREIVDMTAGLSSHLYDITKKLKILGDDDTGTLGKLSQMIVDAEDGRMPTKTDADEVVHVPKKDEIVNNDPAGASRSQRVPATNIDEPAPALEEIPKKDTEDTKDAPLEPAQDTTDTENALAVPEPAQACAPTEYSLLDLIQKYVGNDVLQVFGDTGAGKSKFCFEVAMQAISAGKKVYYLDTERNLTDADVAHLKGCDYHYTPVLDEIDKIVQNLPAVDVVILDSIGFPVLTTYARLSMKQKGDALLKLIAIFGDLKTWAYKNNGVAVVTNQPESEFNKEKGHIFRPFGDKSQFACKEIWKTKIKTRGASETNILIEAFRSRSVGMGAKIAMMKITDSGVEVVT